MRQYNIPHLWRRDIATCGTYPDAFSRNLLWYNWTETQKLHAQSMYNPVFDRLEELCKLKEEHYKFFNSALSTWFLSLNQVIEIDCSKQYSVVELLKLVDLAIDKENKAFDEELLETVAGWED